MWKQPKLLRRRWLLVWAACVTLSLGCVGLFFIAWRAMLPPEARASALEMMLPSAALVPLLAVIIIAGTGIFAAWVTRTYFVPLLRMAEEVQLISTSNTAARLSTDVPRELRSVADATNGLAVQFARVIREDASRIEEARAELERERHRLAALMAELHQGVVVCNADGRIVLYNERARHLFTQPSTDGGNTSASAYMGLGRSLYSLLDKNSITHALTKLRTRIANDAGERVTSFTTTLSTGTAVRATVAVVADSADTPSNDDSGKGFVLLLDDASRDLPELEHRDVLLQTTIEQTRSALASLRAATEHLSAHPDMPNATRQRFVGIVHDEALRLSAVIEQAGREHTKRTSRRSDLEPMRLSELGATVIGSLKQETPLELDVATLDANSWVQVDSYSLLQAVQYLVGRITRECTPRRLTLSAAPAGEYLYLDLAWSGRDLSAAEVLQWETAERSAAGCLREIIERNCAEVWYEPETGAGRHRFRIMLRALETPASPRRPTQPSRPVYYDFNLFQRSEAKHGLIEHALRELPFTAFDTETTGLEPSAGDEIISIGAVRIVNGRLLEGEFFDQLVDPARPIDPESIKIHGIRESMLVGQPAITAVLPAFHRFCEDTVLLGHNIAFDLRFLQIKEPASGVCFNHPVLDTLLLSAVLHEAMESHRLEAIAQRLGVDVIARHTALGDALLTAAVFLRMLPLLAARGIVTLGQALAACERTYYAKLRY